MLPERGDPIVLQAEAHGWWCGASPLLQPGDRYRLRLDGGRVIPDPCSRSQPEGVHGPSAVTYLDDFPWTDSPWRGIALADLVISEIHLGTFTDEGTCDAAIAHLPALVELGITAIELMPVAQCPGVRNWGYDGVFPFAVQHSLGGPAALQRLVDACHRLGLAVLLDVVYNHLGPEGSHLEALLPFTTAERSTPWGPAVNVDGRESDGVRDLLLANVRQWIDTFHIDGFRIDAVHLIPADGAQPFVAELSRRVAGWALQAGRPLHLIGEAGINARRFVLPAERGGLGLHSQWADDFHHALHALLTGETRPPSNDFGTVEDLRHAFAHGFVYDGRWCVGRQQTWGEEAGDLPTDCFVVCAQNHDQIGNRPFGERLASLTDAAGLRCALAAVLLSPYVPLLFMGEEWGERAPFAFFVDQDPATAEAIRRSRREQFAAIFGDDEPPDPFAPATRDAARLDRAAATREPGRRLRGFVRACLAARRAFPSLRPGPRTGVSVAAPHPAVIAVERRQGVGGTLLLLNPTVEPAAACPLPPGRWWTVLSSEAEAWGGSGWDGAAVGDRLTLPPRSAVLLVATSP